MVDYEHMEIFEVKQLVRQGNADAMYEMAFRHSECLPLVDRNNPVERCAWQDYWFEKAADAGHIEAKSRYARSLINRIFDAEYRKKAMKYFESLVNDFDSGKLSADQELDGIISKLWLGVMLCQGLGTRRDSVEGRKLIEDADRRTNSFAKFGFSVLTKLAEVYGQGCTQSGGNPTISDLGQAIKYQEAAINRFNHEKDDPNNRGYLDLARAYLEAVKGRKDNKEKIEHSTYDQGFVEWQEEMMKISSDAQKRLEADKTALERMRQRLTREGW